MGALTAAQLRGYFQFEGNLFVQVNAMLFVSFTLSDQEKKTSLPAPSVMFFTVALVVFCSYLNGSNVWSLLRITETQFGPPILSAVFWQYLYSGPFLFL